MKGINTQSIQSILSFALKSHALTVLEAEVLLAHVLGVSRSYLYTWHEKSITAQQREAFESLVFRRSAGEPVAYLMGSKEFWSLPLVVSKDVLIPRPETECLVELVLSKVNNTQGNLRVLDLGTGSGAIALALAGERPTWHIIGVDRSIAALEIAELNAKNNRIGNVNFICSDWFSCFEADNAKKTDFTAFDVIVGNPPYVDPNDIHLAGELRYEPKEALISSPDGLQDLKKIAEEAPRYLVSKGWLFLEHGFDQSVFVKKIMRRAGLMEVETYKDLAGLNRVTIGLKP